MAHYTFLDENNIVIEVIVGKDEDDTETLPEGFTDWEQYYLTKRELASDCKRTSYNTAHNQHITGGTAFRGNYAGVGSVYDASNDVFYSPQPYDSWTLNTSSWTWEAPTAMPDDGEFYFWNEFSQSWDLQE